MLRLASRCSLVSCAALAIAVAGCKLRLPSAPSELDAAPQARAILGPAVPWNKLPLEASELNRNMDARRLAGWASMEQVLERVSVIHPDTKEPLLNPQGEPVSIPVWQTWYELNEFKEMLKEVWRQLDDDQRQARQSDPEIVDAVMKVHHEQKLRGIWQQDGQFTERFYRLLSQVKTENLAGLNGVSGRGYTLHSPATIRHYLLNYGQMLACEGHDALFSTGDESKDFATCMTGPFPEGSASIKATWVVNSEGIAVFDTTAAGLARMLGKEDPTWTPADASDLADPDATSIYTSTAFINDQEAGPFRLTGLHLTTKDIPEWMWVSMWWAPDPNNDFGQDRPESFKTLGPSGAPDVWTNYKMCVASTFREEDERLAASAKDLTTEEILNADDRSLPAALTASYHFSKPGSWCSNPFIEFQDGVGNTNCIGCHQHAGPFSSGATMDADRLRVRQSFMADFLWSYESHRESFRAAAIEVVFR